MTPPCAHPGGPRGPGEDDLTHHGLVVEHSCRHRKRKAVNRPDHGVEWYSAPHELVVTGDHPVVLYALEVDAHRLERKRSGPYPVWRNGGAYDRFRQTSGRFRQPLQLRELHGVASREPPTFGEAWTPVSVPAMVGLLIPFGAKCALPCRRGTGV
jgi:hypothetical protein